MTANLPNPDGRDCKVANGSRVGPYGRAVENGDGLLHIEKCEGETFCGEAFDAYTLHWDTRTVIACGSCLIAAGVPIAEGHRG